MRLKDAPKTLCLCCRASTYLDFNVRACKTRHGGNDACSLAGASVTSTSCYNIIVVALWGALCSPAKPSPAWSPEQQMSRLGLTSGASTFEEPWSFHERQKHGTRISKKYNTNEELLHPLEKSRCSWRPNAFWSWPPSSHTAALKTRSPPCNTGVKASSS